MGKCEVFTLSLCRQTDGQMDCGKTICPLIFRYGGIKIEDISNLKVPMTAENLFPFSLQNNPRKKPFEIILGKGEKTCNQHFHLFQ